MKPKTILIVGGDQRQIKLAEVLSKKGYEVCTYGQGNEGEELKPADIIVLPIPCTTDGININAPLSKHKISIKSIENIADEKTKIFGGMMPETIFYGSGAFVYDYNLNEPLTIFNAAFTAEAALAIAIENSDTTIFKSECLVAGNGRIGKILSRYLRSLGAHVTVLARKEADLTFIEIDGNRPMTYDELPHKIDRFDFIFNTVPQLIFNSRILALCPKHALIIDLASLPGGVDFKEAERQGIKTIHALSLPGKYSPRRSAEYIAKTIIPFF